MMLAHHAGRRLGARLAMKTTLQTARPLPRFLHTSAALSEKVVAKQVPVFSYPKEHVPIDTRSLAEAMADPIPPEPTLFIDSPSPSTNKVEHLNIAEQDDQAYQPPTKLMKSTFDHLPTTLQKFTLGGKVCVVTGGARGLGYNMAEALAECGAKAVVLLDFRRELGDAAAALIHARSNIPVKFYQVDVRDETAVSEVVGNIHRTFGGIDVLINSAGIAESNVKAEDYAAESFRRTLEVNVTGSFLVAQACGKVMMQTQSGGSIIFIASMSGLVVNYPQEQSCYNASKAAVIQLARSLAAEWAQHGIRVNCISPGYMDTALNRVPALDAQKRIWTQMTPQQRLGGPEELNGLAVLLASSNSAFITGGNFVIDGGYTVW